MFYILDKIFQFSLLYHWKGFQKYILLSINWYNVSKFVLVHEIQILIEQTLLHIGKVLKLEYEVLSYI